LGVLKEGASITLGKTTDEITTEISGPVSIIENPQLGGFRYLTYSPLKVSAEHLEDEARLEDKVGKP